MLTLDIAHEIVRRGHEIGSHGHGHERSRSNRPLGAAGMMFCAVARPSRMRLAFAAGGTAHHSGKCPPLQPRRAEK